MGPKDHISIRISHSGAKARYKGDTRNLACRILMFMWSFGSASQACSELVFVLAVLQDEAQSSDFWELPKDPVP